MFIIINLKIIWAHNTINHVSLKILKVKNVCIQSNKNDNEEFSAQHVKDVKKMGNLKMFQNMTMEQIKKLKIGPDGKPLSAYKIKKYILP